MNRQRMRNGYVTAALRIYGRAQIYALWKMWGIRHKGIPNYSRRSMLMRLAWIMMPSSDMSTHTLAGCAKSTGKSQPDTQPGGRYGKDP